MMAQSTPIQNLRILGYADSLTPEMLPTTVPPVFATTEEPQSALLPPYTISDGILFGATSVPVEDLPHLAAQGKITLFQPVLDARVDFLLWIGQDRVPHYEHRAQARAWLDRFARGQIAEAESLLRRGALAEADAACNAAISANDRFIEPIAIQAAIRRLQRKETQVAVMARMAADRIQAESFDALVQHYCPTARETAQAPSVRLRRSPMHNIAREPLAA